MLSIILAAMVAASPVDSVWRFANIVSEPCDRVCQREVDSIIAANTEPDTIGYWLNRRIDYNSCNTCSPLDEYGSTICTAMACKGREVVDTIFVMKKR